MASPTFAQVLIVAAAGVYVFLAVMTSVLLGGDGFMLFLTTSSAGLSSLASTVWAGLVSLVTTVWAGLVSFVAAAPAHTEMMRISLLSTIEYFLSPWNLMVVYMMFFTGICTINWEETKSASSSVYKVAAEVTRAVWAVLSNPHKMLQYGVLVVMVRLLPDVVERLRVRQ